MQIAKHIVVSMEYTLKNEGGEVIDQTGEGEAFSFIHGIGSIISGLEDALAGKAEGDALEVTIPPEEAYGMPNDQLRNSVPRGQFQDVDSIEVGMMFQTQNPDGSDAVVTVVAIDDENITVDANHPLAGETLNFDVKIVGVREASQEELEHGHVHGPEGHDHG
jgi:FKBP-type peptidyl-prolyl cis-trans isomerase SlyD